MRQEIQTLLTEQLASWELARNNYAALSQIRVKELMVDGIRYQVQFNPARIVSSAAKVDASSIQERKCFLCPAHLPEAQKGLPFQTGYQILVNPFPIFPQHLTVPALEHADQRILSRFADLLDLAEAAVGYVTFYNGPRCGASAPDHVHFQAGSKGFLPIEQEWESQKAAKVGSYRSATIWYLNDAPRTTLVMEAKEREDAVKAFHIIYKVMEAKEREDAVKAFHTIDKVMEAKEWEDAVKAFHTIDKVMEAKAGEEEPKAGEEEPKAGEEEPKAGEEEPMMNLLAWTEEREEVCIGESTQRWVVCIFPREKHRPACYTAEGENHLLISPASVDMGGVFITPREEDFEKVEAEDIAAILSEVCLPPDRFRQLRQRIKEQCIKEQCMKEQCIKEQCIKEQL